MKLFRSDATQKGLGCVLNCPKRVLEDSADPKGPWRVFEGPEPLGDSSSVQ